METNYNIVEIKQLPDGKKEAYLPPSIDLLELKIEKGFAASPVGSGGSSTGDWGWGSW